MRLFSQDEDDLYTMRGFVQYLLYTTSFQSGINHIQKYGTAHFVSILAAILDFDPGRLYSYGYHSVKIPII